MDHSGTVQILSIQVTALRHFHVIDTNQLRPRIPVSDSGLDIRNPAVTPSVGTPSVTVPKFGVPFSLLL